MQTSTPLAAAAPRQPHSPSSLRIALVGCGAIGSEVLQRLPQLSGLRVDWVLARQPRPEVAALLAQHAPGAQLLPALPEDARPDLLVECAGHSAIASHTAQPTRMARVTDAPPSPAISSPVDSGGIR